MPTDPRDLAARPAFAQFLAALKGGEGPCPRCGGRGRLGSEDPDWPGPHPELGPLPVECPRCGGSGRVAVPPDPRPDHVGAAAADWWQEQGGDLAGMLVAFAERREPHDVCEGQGCPYCDHGEIHDPVLQPALAALTERDEDPRVRALTAAVRGLCLEQSPFQAGLWCVKRERLGVCMVSEGLHNLPEPAARLALQAAVLSLYDPLVRVPCRAEGSRLTYQNPGYTGGREVEWATADTRDVYWGKLYLPASPHSVFRLDGVRVGAPPDWSWTPHALPCGRCRGEGWVPATAPGNSSTAPVTCPGCGGSGGRLLVTWEAVPSALLPAAAPDATRPRCAGCGGLRYVVRDRYRTTCRACDGTGFEDEAARQREAERAWRGEEPLY